MEEITPDNTRTEETPRDILLYLRSLKKEINELDDNYIVIFVGEDGKKVGKMEFTKIKTKLQGNINVLTSYDFSDIQEELNKYQSVNRSPIADISEYIKTLL
jgi:hypothetical protein